MTMPGNGHTAVDRGRVYDVLKLGETTEEKRPVEVNGRQLWAWVTNNGRYPSNIAAQLDDARNRWLASRHPVDAEQVTPASLWQACLDLAELFDGPDQPSPERVKDVALALAKTARRFEQVPEMRSSEVDWQGYITEALCILIPGLEYQEADLLMPEARLGALYELGYMRPPGAATPNPDSGADDDDGGGEPQVPPEKGPSSTGDEPEPVSVATTE